MTSWYMTASLSRRCEERSDAAISLPFLANVGCHDNQAMQRHRPRPASAAKLLRAKRSVGPALPAGRIRNTNVWAQRVPIFPFQMAAQELSELLFWRRWRGRTLEGSKRRIAVYLSKLLETRRSVGQKMTTFRIRNTVVWTQWVSVFPCKSSFFELRLFGFRQGYRAKAVNENANIKTHKSSASYLT